MPNYDLYTELGLDKDMPPTEIGALLDGRINGLVGQGYPSNSPEVDQLATARAILSDPAKRNTYEAALAGPDGVIDVSWLHQLADSPAASEASSLSSPSSESAESSPVPSYDAASTSVINAAGDAESSSSSSSSSADGAGSSQSPYGQYSGYGQQDSRARRTSRPTGSRSSPSPVSRDSTASTASSSSSTPGTSVARYSRPRPRHSSTPHSCPSQVGTGRSRRSISPAWASWSSA